MYIERFLDWEIRKRLDRPEIFAIIGPRQSGKTTLLKNILKNLENAIFLDFGDRTLLELFTEDIESFIDLYIKKYKYVFIDQFQYAKDGGKNLKYIYDNYKTKIIITGSSATDLSIQSIKYLVGRIFVFNLYPLSFEEFLNFKQPEIYKIYCKRSPSKQITEKIFPIFQEFCIFGGYPQVALSNDEKEKELVLKNIYNTYFLKEIKEILNLPGDHKLSKLIRLLSIQSGGMVNYNDISSITGFSYHELLNHLNILEKTFITLTSRPFFTNKKTELVKAPKIFFLDNGFRNIVINNFNQLKNRQDKGFLYENFVASEIAKANYKLNYWRSKSKAEVDFVIEGSGKIMPFEIKSDLLKPKITKSLHSFIDRYRQGKFFVLSETLWEEKTPVSFRPIFYISRLLK